MTEFYLIRHGEADYSHTLNWQTSGWGADLAPLTNKGVAQIESLVSQLESLSPVLLLTSPTTRTLQGTLILQQALQLPVKVEFDLHEWVPDRTFNWSTLEEVNELYADLNNHNGEWPDGEQRKWEPLSAVRQRALDVLMKYGNTPRVLVMCHGVLIRALTGVREVENAQVLKFTLP